MGDSGNNSVCDPTPPWLLGKPQNYADEVTLHDEIQMFCKWISPTREEQMMRESVIVRISCVVCQLWPTAQVKTYGSYATQLYLPNSDVDLCVTGAPQGPQSLITLAEVLHAKELSTQLHVISSAKVPIIKLTDKVSGSIVDISLNQDVRTNELVSSYMERFPSLRPLTLVLKLFLFQRRLHESYTGGLSSFSLLIIIVSFLQFHVPDTTNKNASKITNKCDLGALLIDFFKFYGKQFDYEHMGISIRDCGSYFPKIARNWYDPFNPCVFSLESPLDQASDVGRGGFATPRVVGAFAKAYDDLVAGRMLSSVLNVDSNIIERRTHINSLYARQNSPNLYPNRTQRSVSATATLQTVSPNSTPSPSLSSSSSALSSRPFKTSVAIPIPSLDSAPISISVTPTSSAATSSSSSSHSPRTSTSATRSTNNSLSISTSAPTNPVSSNSLSPNNPHTRSPPSPPTPIHISPATSPRIPSSSASCPNIPSSNLASSSSSIPRSSSSSSSRTHPQTISGFETKATTTTTDSSTDTEDTDTDQDADVDTDSGDHIHRNSQKISHSLPHHSHPIPCGPINSVSKNGIICNNSTLHEFNNKTSHSKPPFYNCHHQTSMGGGGLDYYLRTHFQPFHSSSSSFSSFPASGISLPVSSSRPVKLSNKSAKRLQRMQQLQHHLLNGELSESDVNSINNVNNLIAAGGNNSNNNVHNNINAGSHRKGKQKQRNNNNNNNNNNANPISSTPPKACVISESTTNTAENKLEKNEKTKNRKSNTQRRNSNPHNNNRRNSNPNNNIKNNNNNNTLSSISEDTSTTTNNFLLSASSSYPPSSLTTSSIINSSIVNSSSPSSSSPCSSSPLSLSSGVPPSASDVPFTIQVKDDKDKDNRDSKDSKDKDSKDKDNTNNNINSQQQQQQQQQQEFYKTKYNARANTKQQQQRWAPKVPSAKKLNTDLLQSPSCSVPVSN